MSYDIINKSQAAVLKALARISIDDVLGGKDTVSFYALSEICAMELSVALNNSFGVRKIEELLYYDFDDAIEFLIEWSPSQAVKDVSDELEEDFADFRYRYVDELPPESPAYQQMKEDYLDALCSDAERLD